ncbi:MULTISPECIES: hypothetical protein [Sorangium]|uniref:Uncharacterized protein n=1 Tax=Sorangium cellulosum (strain So ce56) TaxID=448385 RepID=A9FD41_SORC5|nr:hypothetical protein [Sorangium cellulosum]CAN91725.1 hypothetical protein predicted by Glimmer/Critica [Sorangium cellulosum So ce56]
MNLRELFFDAFALRVQPSADRLMRPTDGRHESDRLRELLATRRSTELTDYELRTVVEGNLWLLTSEAFLYFLPAFLSASLERYDAVSVFASELLGALTEPSRGDVVEALDRLARPPSALGLPVDMVESLREQQLEWFDSGDPAAIFHERFDGVTRAEGAAILAFLVAFQQAHGADFPFDEIKTAIDRYWARYGDP